MKTFSTLISLVMFFMASTLAAAKPDGHGKPVVNGVCGSANSSSVATVPTSNLCAAGKASVVSGNGPWTWSCIGAKGGQTVPCGATLVPVPPPVPPPVPDPPPVVPPVVPPVPPAPVPPPPTPDPAPRADRDASANWKMAGMLSVGGIPNRQTVCTTLSPAGNGADDTQHINAAISACPLGQAVSLAAGTFTIAEGSYVLLNKAITLRGAGAGKTILTRSNGAALGSANPGSSPSPIVLVGPQRYNNASSLGIALTADAVAGNTSIQLASTAGFAVGQMVLLDEASGAGWQPERIQAWVDKGYPQIWAAPDYRVVWQKHNPAYQYVDDFSATGSPADPSSAGCWFSNCDRPTSEIKQIAAISGNTITFDSPVMISYRTTHQARLYYWNDSQVVRNAGVENLTVAHGDDGNIKFQWCAQCWAKNVEDTLWLGHGIDIMQSLRVQIEGAYVHDGAWPVNGGGGYAIALNWGSSEALIQDSITMLANKNIVAQSAGAGSVVAYNYFDAPYILGSTWWTEVSANASHMTGPHHVLFEGNYAPNADSDQTHGNSIYMTFLRNWFSGFRKPFTSQDGKFLDDAANCCGPLRAVGVHAYAYWFSFMGNVLGTPGKMAGWYGDAMPWTTHDWIPSNAIWSLGWMDITPNGGDQAVSTTLFRDGNYDYVSNAIQWDASNTTHTVPNSLYLTAKPAFFEANPWPWVDPVGTQQTYVLPAKARYDAGIPNRP